MRSMASYIAVLCDSVAGLVYNSTQVAAAAAAELCLQIQVCRRHDCTIFKACCLLFG